MIVGTAGHVDHGKTSLVKALTGVDTDRLPEEKRRGITLELGFAPLTLPSGEKVSVVDVPGHERFVKTMAAGAGGVDIALLVVAADEGVMPQTREHLDICALLGVRAGIVVITKADLLPALGADWRALLDADIAGLTHDTFLDGAAVVAVSAVSGQGVGELLAQLDRLAAHVVPSRDGSHQPPSGREARSEGARPPKASQRPAPSQSSPEDKKQEPSLAAWRRADGPLFLPIDRAFTVKGFGVVVTGTLASGHLDEGDELLLVPGGTRVRVRGLQAHGAAVPSLGAGQRAAVNVQGVELGDVWRGQALVRAGELTGVTSLAVELTLLPSVEAPLKKRSRLSVSLGTDTREAVVRLVDRDELQPGQTCFAHLHFAAAVAALPQLRFIARGTWLVAHRGATIAGGRVLALDVRRRRHAASEQLASFAASALEPRVTALLDEAGYEGCGFDVLRAQTLASVKDLERVLSVQLARGLVVLLDKEARRYVAAGLVAALTARLLERLEAFHQESPEREGLSQEDLRQRCGGAPERTFKRALADAMTAGRLEQAGDVVHLPGRGRAFTAAAATHKAQLLALLQATALAPPTVAEAAQKVALTEARALELLRVLASEGLAVKADALFFDRQAVAALEAKLVAHLHAHGSVTTQDFKALAGASRKFLIPLAEHFDAMRVTLRVGEKRVLRRKE